MRVKPLRAHRPHRSHTHTLPTLHHGGASASVGWFQSLAENIRRGAHPEASPQANAQRQLTCGVSDGDSRFVGSACRAPCAPLALPANAPAPPAPSARKAWRSRRPQIEGAQRESRRRESGGGRRPEGAGGRTKELRRGRRSVNPHSCAACLQARKYLWDHQAVGDRALAHSISRWPLSL